MTGAKSAAQKWVNLYNGQDVATSVAWKFNNRYKPQITSNYGLWEYTYEYQDITDYYEYRRVDENDDATELTAGLIDEDNNPGPMAYEIVAFISVANSLPIGTKQVDWFDVNVDINELGLSDDPSAPDYLDPTTRANHSFQFYHDATSTWNFYLEIKNQSGFRATY